MIAHSGEYRKKNGQRGCVMMNNFNFENKTKVYFGKGGVKEYLGGLLANFGETIMLAYGGGSIKRNGVYDEIMGILNAQGKCVVEFSGIMSNPTYAKVQEGAKLARASAMAENGVLKIGKVTDFQAHQIQHQLGAYTNCNHGAGLAVIHPVLYRHIYKSGAARFARFAQNVWASHPRAVTGKPPPVSTRWPRSLRKSVCRPALQSWVSPMAPTSAPWRIPPTSLLAAARS